jgi:hypothetical protein
MRLDDCDLDYKTDNFRRIRHIRRKMSFDAALRQFAYNFYEIGKAGLSLFPTIPPTVRRF